MAKHKRIETITNIVQFCEVKDWLKLDTSYDDGVVAGVLEAAVAEAEVLTRHAVGRATYETTYDNFYRQIKLMPTVVSVSSVVYFDDDWAEHVFTDYNLGNDCILPTEYPNTTVKQVKVSYVAETFSPVLKQLVRTLCLYHYEREPNKGLEQVIYNLANTIRTDWGSLA